MTDKKSLEGTIITMVGRIVVLCNGNRWVELENLLRENLLLAQRSGLEMGAEIVQRKFEGCCGDEKKCERELAGEDISEAIYKQAQELEQRGEK